MITRVFGNLFIESRCELLRGLKKLPVTHLVMLKDLEKIIWHWSGPQRGKRWTKILGEAGMLSIIQLLLRTFGRRKLISRMRFLGSFATTLSNLYL